MGGTCRTLSLAVMLSQSVSFQRGLGRREEEVRGWREMRMGTWSDPVDGSDDASNWPKAGNI